MADYSKAILRELIAQVQDALHKLRGQLIQTFPKKLDDALRASPEYASLMNGQLRWEFGLETPEPLLNAIIKAVTGSMEITVLGAEEGSLGGLSIGIYLEHFEDALSSGGEEYTYQSKKYGSVTIPWLRWFLLEGDSLVIQKAEILYDYPNRKVNFRSASRTGKAIMVERNYDTVSRSLRSGGQTKAFGRYNRSLGRSPGWRVPPQFSGVENNNWLTRVATPLIPTIEQEMQDFLNAL